MDASTQSTRQKPETTHTANRGWLDRVALWTLGSYALLAAFALGLRVSLIDYFYPVMRNRDEFFRFLNTMLVRHDMPAIAEQWGVYTFNSGYNYDGFPPVQLWIHSFVQRWVEARMLFPLPPDYIMGARWLSVGFSMAATVFVIWMGWYLARPLGRFGAWVGGFAAGFAFTLSPMILHVGNLGIIDPLLYPYVPLAVIATVYAVRQDAPLGAFLGLVLAIAAIYTKYILVYMLVLPAVATVILAWRRGPATRNAAVRFLRGLWALAPWLWVMALVSAGSMYWLIFEHQMFAMSNRETHLLYRDGLQNALSPYRNGINVASIVGWTTGVGNYIAVVAGGVWAYRFSRRRELPTFEAWVVWVVLPFIVVAFMLISTVEVANDNSRMRYHIPPMVGLLAIWGLCLAQIAIALPSWWREREWPRPRLAVPAVLGVVLLWVFIPKMWDNVSTALAYQQREIQQVVWEYTDDTLGEPEGKILVWANTDDEDWTKFVWDRTVSGYTGATVFEAIHVENPAEGDPEQYYENDVAYMLISEYDRQLNPQFEPFLDELTLLKTFDPAPGTEFASYFYRMLPPEYATDATFGGTITLEGYDLSAQTAAPGDVLTVRPYWRATETPDHSYSMYVHLRPADDPTTNVMQADGPPSQPERLPPTWTDPDELVVGRQVALSLPPDIPTGEYVLWVGLYDFESGRRLTLADGNDGYQIPITIE